jgi:hypothetical protein
LLGLFLEKSILGDFMIAGNPHAGRRVAAVAIAILFLVLLCAVWTSLRKKDAPEKEPPLHPANYVSRAIGTRIRLKVPADEFSTAAQ